MKQLIALFENFLHKGDWSVSSARELEGRLDEFSEVDGVEDLQNILASYRPGGGEFLFDKDRLEKELLFLKNSLEEST